MAFTVSTTSLHSALIRQKKQQKSNTDDKSDPEAAAGAQSSAHKVMVTPTVGPTEHLDNHINLFKQSVS